MTSRAYTPGVALKPPLLKRPRLGLVLTKLVVQAVENHLRLASINVMGRIIG